jgi:hypothetical protein
MKKIYLSKMLAFLIFLWRATNAFAKELVAEATVLYGSGNQRLNHILNRLAIGVTTEWNGSFSLAASDANVLVPLLRGERTRLRFSPFIQFTHLEFRSLN